MYTPFPSPVHERLLDLVESAERDLFLAAPFISRPPLEQIADVLQRRQQLPTVQIFTHFIEPSIRSGSLDCIALEQFAQTIPTTRILNFPNLHAKIYIADERAAIVTSANLTQGGLHRNWEYSLWLNDTPTVEKVRADLNTAAATRATELPPDFLKDLVTRQVDAKKSRVKEEIDEDIIDLLSRINSETRTIEAPDKAVTRIFAEEILKIHAEWGPLPTTAIYPLIKNRYPQHCDDSQVVWIKGTYECKKWERDIRNAQQQLKGKGRIIRDPETKLWRLT